MADFVVAIDQGTTSTRCMLFDAGGRPVAAAQQEHAQILPRPGWVEHDPVEIWERTEVVVRQALAQAGVGLSDLAALGVTNQRESTVVWNRNTGLPYANAIVWQDTRTDAIAAALDGDGRGAVIRQRAGIPPATYFSAAKAQWLLESVPELRPDAEAGVAVVGTLDSWLVWQLTGGVDGGRHVTDVTNASRTMAMDLETLAWDDELLSFFDLPREMLPQIVPSQGSEAFGHTRPDGPFGGELAIGAVLGDQQAAMVGQVCLAAGEAKNTYGTGNFLLLNTGTELIRSAHGLLTTVCGQRAGEPPTYALEGSIAVTGSAVQWLRDQLGVIDSAAEIEALAETVSDAGGIYFVPAFSGLFAPYWRSDARGAILGLSRFHTRGHLARATLEAICFQTRDVVEAMAADAGLEMDELKVDGGVTANALCMQLQADLLGVEISRPQVAETTSLGAGYAAGLAVGFWSGPEDLRRNWREDRRWVPAIDQAARDARYAGWQKAVSRTLDWVEQG